MDFKTYMNQVEQYMKQMTEEQKTRWILDQARIIPEDGRDNFLNELTGEPGKALDDKIKEIQEWCLKVESGEIYLRAEEEEYYPEEYWESEWRTEYYDVFEAMPYLTEAFFICQQLVWQKEYEKAYELLERLCRLEFQDDLEEVYGENRYLNLSDLVQEELISIDLKQIQKNLLYSCYQCSKIPDRKEALFAHLSIDMGKELKMTDILAFGPEELIDADDFMGSWYEYLKSIPGDRAAELLEDVCIYLGGIEFLEKAAQELVDIHPYLYKRCCERLAESDNLKHCVRVAKAALQNIDADKEIRGIIADIPVCLGKDGVSGEDKELFYREAFYSQPNSWHLLRLYVLDNETLPQVMRQRIEAFEKKAKTRKTSINRSFIELPMSEAPIMEQRESGMGSAQYLALYRFLLGDFDCLWKNSIADKEELGWSNSLKATFLSVMLLYFKDENGKMRKADERLLDEVRYRLNFDNRDGKEFKEYLYAWKNRFYLTEQQKTACFDWIREEIDKRTEAVVGGGYRHSYYKAAELIVVLGEIIEEQGEQNGMRSLIDHYKKQHSRKRAFRSEIDELAEEV